MLGVRREGVTEGAGKLQKAGLIRYARGHITVLDRPGLEQRSCECYAVVKKEYDRLLPGQPSRAEARLCASLRTATCGCQTASRRRLAQTPAASPRNAHWPPREPPDRAARRASDRRRLLAHLRAGRAGARPRSSASPATPTRHVYFPDRRLHLAGAPRWTGSPGVEVGMVGREGMLGVAAGARRRDDAAARAGAGRRARRWRIGAAAFRARAGAQRGAAAQPSHRYVVRADGAARHLGGLPALPPDRAAPGALAADEPGPRRTPTASAMTHEFLAYMLGVRRVGITRGAARLQRGG